MVGPAVGVFQRKLLCHGVVGRHPLVHQTQERIHLLRRRILKDRQKLIAAVAADEAHVYRGKLQNIGKIPDHGVALQMAVQGVDLLDIRQVEHDTAQRVRQRPVQIFLNERVAAVAVGNPGHGIGVHRKIQFPVIFFIRSRKRKIQENKEKREAKHKP